MKLRIVLLVILIATILAFKFLPWYVLVGLAVVFVLSIKFLGKKLLLWIFSTPFRAKGAALRGASVEVHSVVPCPAPERVAEELDPVDDEDAVDADEHFERGTEIICKAPADESRNWYRVEATISPQQGNRHFNHWEIGEVGLGLPDYSPMNGDGEGSCPIEALQVDLDGKFTPDEGYKLIGPQRLRFVVGVRPGVSRLVFNYYFEKFGEVLIPTPK